MIDLGVECPGDSKRLVVDNGPDEPANRDYDLRQCILSSLLDTMALQPTMSLLANLTQGIFWCRGRVPPVLLDPVVQDSRQAQRGSPELASRHADAVEGSF